MILKFPIMQHTLWIKQESPSLYLHPIKSLRCELSQAIRICKPKNIKKACTWHSFRRPFYKCHSTLAITVSAIFAPEEA